MFVIEKRKTFTKVQNFFLIIIFIVLSLIMSSLIFLLRGLNPFFVLTKILTSAFGSFYGIKEARRRSQLSQK